MTSDHEQRRPRQCCWNEPRPCIGCGNYIVPGEAAWVREGPMVKHSDGSNRTHYEHYHTNCLVRFLYDAWGRAGDTSVDYFRRMLDAQSREAEWRGNHAHVVKLKRDAEGKGPRSAAAAGAATAKEGGE